MPDHPAPAMSGWLPVYALLILAFVAGGLLASAGMAWGWPLWGQVAANLAALALLAALLIRTRRREGRS